MAQRRLPWKVGCAHPLPPAYIGQERELVLDREAIVNLSPELAGLMSGKLVVTASPVCPTASVYEQNRWETLEEEIMALPNMDPEARRIQRVMLGHRYCIEEQKELKLSTTLTDYLTLDAPTANLWIVVFDDTSAEIWSNEQLVSIAGRPEPEDSSLIQFFRGTGKDHAGRTLEDILALDDFWLEHTHDYIQWLFPIREPSNFNSRVPMLSTEDRAFFRTEITLRLQQIRALDRMLVFYGLERRDREIVPLPGLSMKSHIWLKPAGHNHLRITRIIRSLQQCHQPDLAMGVQDAVIELGKSVGQVSEKSIGYWRSARD